MKNLSGHAFIFGDDIDTDEIIATKYLPSTDSSELAQHCLESVDPDFAKQVQSGDIIVAGKNFGTGTGRLHAPLAIKSCGVSCIIARSFGRIFFRNALNIGLSVIECREAFESVNQGDYLEVHTRKHLIENRTKAETYSYDKLPTMLGKILDSGGLIEAIEKGKIK